MHWIDWLIVIASLVVLAVLAVRSMKYMRKVADFLAADRAGGRYLITSADGMAGIGLISLVAYAQKFRHAGWAIFWWNEMAWLVLTILSISGFVFYRYRQTRAFTMAQFFEMRYDRRYRIVMGIVCWFSGIVNYGIFPAIGGRFFVCFLGLPEKVWGIPSYPLVMFLFLGAALFISAGGGQVLNMVTDAIQALFTYTMCVVVAITVLCMFHIDDFRAALCSNPEGRSFINPFDTANMPDFNIWFFLINLYMCVVGYGAWQGNQGYAASAINPHEAKMGNILSTWRKISITHFNTVFALGAFTILLVPRFANTATAALNSIANLPAAVADQMQMPMAISLLLPIGIKGMFAAVLFYYMLSTDTTYIHSWGCIFVQDIVLPLYHKPVSQKTHILLLRLSLACVAIFAFFFSWLFQQGDYINMFQMATGGIFNAAAGCAIIGGLYWKRATRWAAWAALCVGVPLALFNIFLMDVRGWHWMRELLLTWFPTNQTLLDAVDKCPLGAAYRSLIILLLCELSYITVSFLTCKKPFDLDKMLHRGKYADETSRKLEQSNTAIPWYKRLFLGFDNEFTFRDKCISVSASCWAYFWGGAFLFISGWNVLGWLFPGVIPMWPDSWWFHWLMFYLTMFTVLAPITAVWMTCFTIRDLRRMFKLLDERQKNNTQDDSDDGTVRE